MTPVSSFFAEDNESDCRSFSQLLAGAMASPVGPILGRTQWGFPTAEDHGGKEAAPPEGKEKDVAAPSFFTMPQASASPPCWILLLSSRLGPYGISHQEALAHVTAQASQVAHSASHLQMPVETQDGASWAQPNSTAVGSSLLEQKEASTSVSETAEGSQARQRTQATSIVIDKPSDDGYNWRKYGQKVVKGSECPRSYYKCTHSKCPVKKKVERSLDGQVTEIIYKGEHSHQRPPPPNGNIDLADNLEPGSQDDMGFQSQARKMNRLIEQVPADQAHRRDQERLHVSSEQPSGSDDDEEADVSEVRTAEGSDAELDPKRRKLQTGAIESSSSHRTVTEPRIIVQTTSDVDLLDDGYRWRKYGQKVVKGNPNPRSYYKCTSPGCNVRKQVERASTNPKAVITTYEGKHNHNVPAARNSSHKATDGSSAVVERKDSGGNDQRHGDFLQMKQEREVI
ncbi:unnamed protein product [Spirodela intermedia]|uniref:WRKY domain-containing protein n=1 Tax=Spirodela intermedia TaxID=51605 RepID=A0A7I8JCC2_SPIIN|nr:unnamed protein product [Spirodela intermedia]CAA6667385.1 unnamed protein product [Spirodela intermedia]